MWNRLEIQARSDMYGTDSACEASLRRNPTCHISQCGLTG